jgi:hypothetical protein
MLINYSNTPHKEWSQHKLDEAYMEFSSIIDVPLPVIFGSVEIDELYNIVYHEALRLRKIGRNVLINTEPGFTFNFVKVFKALNGYCYHETFHIDKMEIYDPEGKVKVLACEKFSRFREY